LTIGKRDLGSTLDDGFPVLNFMPETW